MNEQIKLQIEINLLLELTSNSQVAYTGTLEQLKQISCISFTDLLRILNNKREELKNI